MRTCLICGTQLPDDATASRKYCFECARAHEKELQRARMIRDNRKRSEERAKESEKLQPMRDMRAEDKAFCARCIYSARPTEGYLCNYLLITHESRGCRPGKGCDKRKIKRNAPQAQRICERCGAPYTGSLTSHFCGECRKEASRQNIMSAIESRGKKNGG